MDWIERLFGISPDGGNGATEILFMTAVLGIVALAIMYARGGLARRR